MQIQLFRTRNVERKILEEVASCLYNIFSANVEIVDHYIEPPIDIFDDKRMQYLADAFVYHVYRYRNLMSIAIILAEFDAYVKGLNFVFGLAIPHLKTAAVFLPRLAVAASGIVFIERVKKEVIHELGHILGLKHCFRRECVMSFSNSVAEVDSKTVKFCRKCTKLLEKQGYKVGQEYILT